MSAAAASKATTAAVAVASKDAPAAATTATAPAAKTSKAIFVEDIAEYVVSKAPGFPDFCSWTCEVIHICILKATTGNTKVVFKASDTENIPVAFSAVFDARRKGSKHSEHSYNALIVKAGGTSAFCKAAPKLNYAAAPPTAEADVAANADLGAAAVGGGIAGASLRAVMTGKKFDVCVAALDRCISMYKKDGKSDDKSSELVVPGFGRLDAAKFILDRGNFYEVISLNPSMAAQRQVAVNEYIIGHNMLLSTLTNSPQPKKDDSEAEPTYLIRKEKYKVGATFDERMGRERENFNPRDVNGNIKVFQRMLKLVEDFNPANFVKDVVVQ